MPVRGGPATSWTRVCPPRRPSRVRASITSETPVAGRTSVYEPSAPVSVQRPDDDTMASAAGAPPGTSTRPLTVTGAGSTGTVMTRSRTIVAPAPAVPMIVALSRVFSAASMR